MPRVALCFVLCWFSVRSVLTDVADTTTGSWLGAMQLLEMHGYDPQRAKDYYYGSMAGTPTVGDGGGGADDELVIDDGTVNCLVCWDDVAVSDALCLDCGHMACKSCWGDAINEAVEERSLLKATCVNAGCNLAVSESIIERVAGDKVVLQLKDDLLDQLVLAKPGVSRCCNADCPLVLVFPPERFQSIPCFCGSRTCVDCGHEAHEPATCGMRTEYELQKHNAKERGNMSESLWAATHVKPCPRCSIPMEKTRGCMHSTYTVCMLVPSARVVVAQLTIVFLQWLVIAGAAVVATSSAGWYVQSILLAAAVRPLC